MDFYKAAARFGTQPHPSALGTISKHNSDGSFKHRLIQGMGRSVINDAVRPPERQVLLRPIDHAVDLTRCAHAQ